MHPHAEAAVRAARNWNRWGRFAALRYAKKRNCPVRLIALARFLNRA